MNWSFVFIYFWLILKSSHYLINCPWYRKKDSCVSPFLFTISARLVSLHFSSLFSARFSVFSNLPFREVPCLYLPPSPHLFTPPDLLLLYTSRLPCREAALLLCHRQCLSFLEAAATGSLWCEMHRFHIDVVWTTWSRRGKESQSSVKVWAISLFPHTVLERVFYISSFRFVWQKSHRFASTHGSWNVEVNFT